MERLLWLPVSTRMFLRSWSYGRGISRRRAGRRKGRCTMTLMTNSFRKRFPLPIKRKKLRLTIQSRNSIAENPKNLFRTRLGTCNVSFKYLYRDASNYKLHGEAVFTNHTFVPIDEIEKQIRSNLRDSEFFIAQQINIEERFFDVLHEEDDHPWHEF